MDAQNNGISNEQAIKNFLLDIDCLNELSRRTDRLNIFNILSIERKEVRHSNMLAWLMRPVESHGLGELFLRGMFQLLVQSVDGEALDAFKLLTMDFSSFSVYREWRYIDLLAVSDAEKVILCIENKIDSKERGDQLKRYQKAIEMDFPDPDYIKIFAYLTPYGKDCSASDTWISISYENILRLIETCLKRSKLPKDAEILIAHYIDVLRRDIVKDERLVRVCREIYEKHRQALDLIYENRLDPAYLAFEAIQKWCEQKKAEGVIGYDPQYSIKTMIRFTTPTISKLLPDHHESVSGWKSKSMYFYEIMNKAGGEKVYVQLSLSSQNTTDEQKEKAGRLSEILGVKDKKPDWIWKTLYTTSKKPVKLPQLTSDTYEEGVFSALDGLLEQVQSFEKGLT